MEWSFDEIRGFIPKSISLPYSREEKNGYRSVLTGRDELNYIMLNGSGSYIVSLCDGKNTVALILIFIATASGLSATRCAES